MCKVKDYRKELIDRLKESNKSVVIYGAGKFAIHAAECLDREKIDTLCFVVDDDYYIPNKTISLSENRNKDVLTIEILKKVYNNYNVVIGFLDYNKAKTIMNNQKVNFPECDIIGYLDAVPSHIMDNNFLKFYKDALYEIYAMLADIKSKDVMEAYIYSRVCGIPEKLCQFYEPSKGQQGAEYDYELLDCNASDILVDCGAYDGDTIKEFLNYTDNYFEKIYAFEPDKMSFDSLIEQIDKIHCGDKILYINKGVWSKTEKLKFKQENSLGSNFVENGNIVTEVTTIDKVLDGNKATIIKMDIEGSEIQALCGAASTILRYMPKLAICIYHKNDDIVNIPKLIVRLSADNPNKEYKFFLRQHSFSVEETVLYAIPYNKFE